MNLKFIILFNIRKFIQYFLLKLGLYLFQFILTIQKFGG